MSIVENNSRPSTAPRWTSPVEVEALPQTATIIELDGLEVNYKDFKAVRGISLRIEQGEIFGILGPNGAGKTTTLSVIEGLRQPSAGTVRVLGYDVVTQSKEVRQRIGVALQTTAFFDNLNLVELAQTYAAMYNHYPTRKEIISSLERFNLAEKAGVRASQLSGGQAQRMALLLAIINQPQIVFLDEPTTGLDPQARRNIWELIKELRAEGRTIVLTTHYMEEAQELCHRLAVVDHGEVIALGTPGQLINQIGGEVRLTITCRLPLEEVLQVAGVNKAEYEGARLTVYLERAQADDGIVAVQKLALEHNQPLTDMSIKQPDLEDVFLALTGRGLRP
jgi:ABC-2 type transport system ATP-binding protein